jgi:hypothetical protein
MKRKTIKSVITKKFNDFTHSITDPRVSKLVQDNSIITGGCIASMLLGEEVNDYDIYFTNQETVLAVCEYYCGIFNSKYDTNKFMILNGFESFKDCTLEVNDAPVSEDWYNANIIKDRITIRVLDVGIAEGETDVDDKYRPVYISSNAITLSDDIQLIIRFFGDAQEIHTNYDYEHCKCWWTSFDGHLELPALSLECLLAKELIYTGSKYPLASIIRSRKFINRGFSINAGQYLKMCYDLNNYNLRDRSVLEDQLTGIDAFWFAQMISCIDSEKLVDDVDNCYLFTLIDRFF